MVMAPKSNSPTNTGHRNEVAAQRSNALLMIPFLNLAEHRQDGGAIVMTRRGHGNPVYQTHGWTRASKTNSRPARATKPRFVLTPLVLSPGAVPVVADVEQVRSSPELAIISAIAYGKGKHTLAVALAAFEAARGLDEWTRRAITVQTAEELFD